LAVPELAVRLAIQLERSMMRLKLFSAGIVSAILYHMSLPPSLLPALGWVALLPFLYALESTRSTGPRAGYFLALPFGLLLSLLTFRWMLSLNEAADLTIPGIMVPAVLLWGLYLSLYPLIFVRLLIFFRRYLGGMTFLLAPVLWTLLEWVRGSGVIAFSWIHLSQSQAGHGGYLAPAGWVGGLGLGFLMVLVQSSLVALLLAKQGGRRTPLIALVSTLLLCLLAIIPGHRETGKTIRVAAIQSNISLQDKWESHYRMENLRLHRELSLEARDEGAELLVWPETAFPVSLVWDRHANVVLRETAMDLEAEIVTGFQGLGPDPGGGYIFYNAAGLLSATGALEGIYSKVHLLPFGERIPLADLLAPGLEIDLGQSNFTPGQGVRVFQSEKIPLSVFICYEMGFAGTVRRSAKQGARLLVNITNDGWFEHPLAMELHAALSAMRAAENGLPVIRSGNSGISMILDPRGREIGRLPRQIRAKLVADIPVVSRPSFYARHGHWSSPMLLGLYCLLPAGIIVRRRGATVR
jgi:apolipoprotein N-acyltransferase